LLYLYIYDIGTKVAYHNKQDECDESDEAEIEEDTEDNVRSFWLCV